MNETLADRDGTSRCTSDPVQSDREDDALFEVVLLNASRRSRYPRVFAHEDHKRFIVEWARGSASFLNGVTGRLWPPTTPEALLSRGDWTVAEDLDFDEVLRILPVSSVAVYDRDCQDALPG